MMYPGLPKILRYPSSSMEVLIHIKKLSKSFTGKPDLVKESQWWLYNSNNSTNSLDSWLLELGSPLSSLTPLEVMGQNMFAPTSSTVLESRDTLRKGRVPATKLRQSQMSSQTPKSSKRQVSQMSSNILQEYFSSRQPSQDFLSSFPKWNVSHSPTNFPTTKKTEKEHKSTHQKPQDPPAFFLGPFIPSTRIHPRHPISYWRRGWR